MYARTHTFAELCAPFFCFAAGRVVQTIPWRQSELLFLLDSGDIYLFNFVENTQQQMKNIPLDKVINHMCVCVCGEVERGREREERQTQPKSTDILTLTYSP